MKGKLYDVKGVPIEADMTKINIKIYILAMVTLFWSALLFANGPDMLWLKTYGTSEDDWAYSVEQTSDGGYIVAGYTYSFSTAYAWALKMDSNGIIGAVQL